jgi:hypothetical protein
MNRSLESFIILLFVAVFLNACKSAETTEEPNTNTFSDYQSAETWIKQNHQAETTTPDSSLFKKLEYYPAENTGYLICYLHRGKITTILYQNITRELWNDFNNAKSKGKFYTAKILGNKNFILEVK